MFFYGEEGRVRDLECVEFELTYSVCYPILLTHVSYYYDILVFLATVVDSCLSESSVALNIAYIIKSRLLSMTYKVLPM